VKRFIIAITLIALLPASAYAQFSASGGDAGEQSKGPATARTDKEKKQDAAVDKAYRDTVNRIGGKPQPATTDPWGSIRSTGGDSAKK
jgi:hypothetical protein